jgi:hypothetical protein
VGDLAGIPAGWFLMGDPEGQDHTYPNPKPSQHVDQGVGAEQIDAATKEVTDAGLCHAEVDGAAPFDLGRLKGALEPIASGRAETASSSRRSLPLTRWPTPPREVRPGAPPR